MTAPKRRWFRFGLITIVIVVVSCAVLAAGLIWLRPAEQKFDILGTISADEVEAIKAVLSADPRVTNKVILTLDVLRPEHVNVEMGEECPGCKFGKAFSLEKSGEVWKIVSIGEWNE